MDSEVLIELKNIFFKHGKNWTLKNFNLKIHKNSIYSLLGPSGAGKTTVIGIILRELQPQYGEMNLNDIKSRKDYGYMPQNPSLFDDLTIKESLMYYSYVFGLKGRIPEKTKQLLDMLEIYDLDVLTCYLSGGQKRRVSFAIALIHEPQFLLLDEPTASLDCIHSQSIWNYLLELTQRGTTILLTTHYVQEAINSTQIGFLRKGKIIVEGDPTSLIEKYGTIDFEEIFLKLSLTQETYEDHNKDENGNEITNYSLKFVPKLRFEGDKMFKCCSFKAQLIKNAIWIKRNIPMLLCHLILPFLFGLIYGVAYGKDPIDLKVGILSPVKTSCIDPPLNYNELLNCTLPVNYECFIYKRLLNKFKIEEYDNFEIAQKHLNNGNVSAILVIESNFSSSLTEFYTANIHFEEENKVTLDDSAVVVAYVDNTDFIANSFLKDQLSKTMLGIFKDIESFCKTRKPGRILPIRFEQPIYGDDSYTYSETSYPAFLCAMSFAFTIVFSTPIILVEKKGGFFKRNIISGLTYIEMVGAHAAVQMILSLIQDVSFLLLLEFGYGYPKNGHFLEKLAIMLACNLTGMAFGFLCGEAFKSDFLVMFTSLGVMNTVWILGGTMWPQEGFPKWLKVMVHFLPLTKAKESMTALIIKKLSVANFVVYRIFIESIFWIILCAFFCTYSFKRNKSNVTN